ncbi:hypothetical protein [Rhodococcus aetherivorans]|uniref:hypothetical protein n=1 Tax=Rhodococcus aetherivorans TaxID=191292 RepID=UPI00163B23E8|nr:hypothetical protein [Rhodococcus aetherivorans]MBC2590399.1 hypothetical protein [Rhodococcus aetherivorans]
MRWVGTPEIRPPPERGVSTSMDKQKVARMTGMDTPPRLTVAHPDALAVADTVLPDDWQPSEDALLTLSIALDLDVNAATVQFVDRYRGKRLSEATPATAPLTSWLHLWCVALVLEDGRRQVRFHQQLRATRAQIEAAHEIGRQIDQQEHEAGPLRLTVIE